MAKVHMTLQGKGGVGKSMISALIAQYKTAKGETPLCIDTDPVNATFEGYKGLHVRHLNILDGDEINTRNFDQLVEWVAASENDVVIDNGSSSFVPLSTYLISNEVPALLQEMGHQVIVHVAVTGGQAYDQTVSGFEAIVTQYPKETIFVVWLNPYWGPVQDCNGISFQDSPEFKANKKRVAAVINVPVLKADTYGRDFSDMLQAHLTFDEALASDSLGIMTRQRLKIVRGQLFDQLDAAMVI